MISWKNLDTLASFKELGKVEKVSLKDVMSGEAGAKRVKNYQMPMAEGMTYCYAAKAVDDKVLDGLKALADEAQLLEKFEALYNGEVINTGEKREGMFFAARTFAMKLGQSVAMLAFTSLAVLGTTQDITSNDLTASETGLRIVAIVAVVFCVLGAVILSFYNEKKVMKTISDAHKEA